VCVLVLLCVFSLLLEATVITAGRVDVLGGIVVAAAAAVAAAAVTGGTVVTIRRPQVLAFPAATRFVLDIGTIAIDHERGIGISPPSRFLEGFVWLRQRQLFVE